MYDPEVRMEYSNLKSSTNVVETKAAERIARMGDQGQVHVLVVFLGFRGIETETKTKRERGQEWVMYCTNIKNTNIDARGCFFLVIKGEFVFAFYHKRAAAMFVFTIKDPS